MTLRLLSPWMWRHVLRRSVYSYTEDRSSILPERLVRLCHATRCHIPESSNYHNHYREILKSWITLR
jgi:hypothetical protein